MKVVLFCGGLGMRLRDYADNVPKPMVPLGYRPLLWHVMKYYAHYGHTDFILCLGYRGDLIKHYFLNYEECLSNDFVLSEGGRRRDLLNSDIADCSKLAAPFIPNTWNPTIASGAKTPVEL